MNTWIKRMLALVAVAALAGCGGGGENNAGGTTRYTVGGSISGLAGTVVLRNNGGDDLTRSANGAFSFATAVAQGAAYNVTVLTPPAGQSCVVASGTGTANANVSNVDVTCAALTQPPPVAPTLTLGFGVKELQFSWTNSAQTTVYRLFERADGAATFVQVGGDIPATTTTATVAIALHRANWANALFYVEACNAAGCSPSAQTNAAGALTAAAGYVKASNPGVNDRFADALALGPGSTSVALSADGNTLAVGAQLEDGAGDTLVDSGAVYVFVRSGGTWTQQGYLKASNSGAGDLFGAAVALSADGNTLAVGAQAESSNAIGVGGDETNNNAPASGAVYVFTRNGGTWSQQSYIKASNTGAQDLFGAAVALAADGNTLAVGAYREDGPADAFNTRDSGAVYIFARAGGTWVQQDLLRASNAEALDNFGRSVALSSDGNTLAVGAPFEDSSVAGVNGNPFDNGAVDSGAVYVFVRAGGAWGQQAYVKASNTDINDQFGSSVALSGDGNTLAIGAIGEASNATGIGGAQGNSPLAMSGAVYVFARNGAAWTQQAYVKASNTGAGDRFGWSAALSADGSTLSVGAIGEASDGSGASANQANDNAVNSGAAYVFTRNGVAWSQQSYVKAPNPGSGDFFGASIALSADGNTLAVGAPLEDSQAAGVGGNQADNSLQDSGAVYLY